MSIIFMQWPGLYPQRNSPAESFLHIKAREKKLFQLTLISLVGKSIAHKPEENVYMYHHSVLQVLNLPSYILNCHLIAVARRFYQKPLGNSCVCCSMAKTHAWMEPLSSLLHPQISAPKHLKTFMCSPSLLLCKNTHIFA